MFFMGLDLRTDNIGIVTNMSWDPMGNLNQVELLFVDGSREYFNPRDIELEQKGEL